MPKDLTYIIEDCTDCPFNMLGLFSKSACLEKTYAGKKGHVSIQEALKYCPLKKYDNIKITLSSTNQ